MMQRRCMPNRSEAFTNASMTLKTTAGSFTAADYVYLTSVLLPEFSLIQKVKKVKVYFLIIYASFHIGQ